jgi:hypothetical protein
VHLVKASQKAWMGTWMIWRRTSVGLCDYGSTPTYMDHSDEASPVVLDPHTKMQTDSS